jgi:hypothetical protein
LQNTWKGLTLAPFPAYHLRNVVGNVWNNWLAGLDNPGFYSDALRLQSGTAKQLQVGGKVVSADKLRRMAEDFGITTGTFVQGELFRRTLPGVGSKVFFTAEDIPGLGRLVTAGLRTGKALENNARLAHFLYRLDQGQDAMSAALSVKKYLFDYSRGLTQFEQSVMRRIFPFYAWTRFNVPLQIAAIVDNPRPYIRLSELVNTVRTKGPGGDEFEKRAAEFRGQDQPFLADFIRENVGIPVRLGPGGQPEYFLLGGWLPAADIEVLGRKDGVIDRLTGLLSPFIKTPIEQLTNKDLFFKRELEQFPGDTRRFLGTEVRGRNIQLLRNIRILSEADRTIRQFQDRDNLTEEQESALSAITRTIFGLKAFEAKPEVEARKRAAKRRKLLRQLRGTIRRELPQSERAVREQLEEE